MKSNAPEFLATLAAAVYEEDPRFFELRKTNPQTAIVHSIMRYCFAPWAEARMARMISVASARDNILGRLKRRDENP